MNYAKMIGLAALGLGAFTALGVAQIKKLNLPQMVQETDAAVFGEITSSTVFKVEDPVDGPQYFTELEIVGRSMKDAKPVTVEIVFRGGFLNEEEGVHNSEAPAADDVRVGNKVVAFYAWSDQAAGRGANFLYLAHGGVYRAVDGPRGTTVLGRGPGYPIVSNIAVEALDRQVLDLYRQKVEGR